MDAYQVLLDTLKSVGAIATPIVVAVFAYRLQRRQKVIEAAMAERIKRVGVLSPLVNQIYSYRRRVGNFLDCGPDEILKAKRDADREFWTFEYLWSDAFKAAYDEFMEDSFRMYQSEGRKASIRAESRYYPKPPATTGDLAEWKAFTEEKVDRPKLKLLYDTLQAAVAKDLGFR